MRSSLWILILTAAAFGAEWGQWRGPELNGSSTAKHLPETLGADTLLWEAAMPGQSAATPAVLDGRVYAASTETGSDALQALCLEAATGRILWHKTITRATQRFGQGNTAASCSPCADETGVVFLFAEGTLVKLDREGEELWRRNIIDDYGPLTLDFGFSSSPLLYQHKLYLPVLRRSQARRGGDAQNLASYLLCVDAASGQTVFKHDRATDAEAESTNAYTTPVVATVQGKDHIVVYGGDYLTGHDPADGTELWRHAYTDRRARNDRLIPTPVADGDRIYCSYPRGVRFFAAALSGSEPVEAKQVWVHDAASADISSPALEAGYLYVIEEKAKTLTCLEAATGEVQWVGQLDRGDMYYASVTAADGKLYMVNRRGVVTVAAADPNAFRILQTLEMGGRPADASMVAVDGKVLLRTAEALYCWGAADSTD